MTEAYIVIPNDLQGGGIYCLKTLAIPQPAMAQTHIYIAARHAFRYAGSMTLSSASAAFSPPASDCPLCPRLVEFRCQNQQTYPAYFNGAVPSFGGLDAALLIVGLAPGLKGANATGRPFTGDYAGELLYPALLRAGLASGEYHGLELRGTDAEAVPRYDRMAQSPLQLRGCRVTNAVRCVPPENKPTPAEIRQCHSFLQAEIAAMPELRVILTLGLVSHQAVLRTLGHKVAAASFIHGAAHTLMNKVTNQPVVVLNSYHTSRYNVNTGRLTQAMFDAVIAQAATLISAR